MGISNLPNDNEKKLLALCKQARFAIRQLEAPNTAMLTFLREFEAYTDELSEKAIGRGIEPSEAIE